MQKRLIMTAEPFLAGELAIRQHRASIRINRDPELKEKRQAWRDYYERRKACAGV